MKIDMGTMALGRPLSLYLREQRLHKEQTRAREVFGRYFDAFPERASHGTGKEGELPLAQQMKVAERLKCIRPDPVGARLRSRCADFMDSAVFCAAVFIVPVAITAWLFNPNRGSLPPGPAPHPLVQIAGAVIGFLLSVKFAQGVYRLLREGARDIRDRGLSSLACDTILSGYISHPIAQKAVISALYERQEPPGSEERRFHASTGRKIRRILDHDLLPPALAKRLADSLDP
jgi:hypothetical protein